MAYNVEITFKTGVVVYVKDAFSTTPHLTQALKFRTKPSANKSAREWSKFADMSSTIFQGASVVVIPHRQG